MSDHLEDRLPSEDQASINSAEELATLWWQNNGGIPDNLRKRVQTAAILCNQPVPTDTREGITAMIRFALDTVTSIPLDKKRINVQLRAYEKGDFNLFDLFQFELGEVAALRLTENPEVLKILHKINRAAYKAQKGALDGDFRADASSALDKSIDETKKTKLDNPIQHVLTKIQKILSVISKFQNVRLLHFDPDPEKNDLLAYNFPKTKRSDSIKNNPYAHIEKALPKGVEDKDTTFKRWKRYEDERGELEVQYIKVKNKDGGCKAVYRLSFGEEEFGYIEYEFEDDDVHKLVLSKCSSISAMMDTFLNDRLKEEIKQLIDTKKKEVQSDHKAKHWPNVFGEVGEYLSQIIQRPLVITCDRKPGDHEKPFAIEINGKKVRLLKSKEESKVRGKSFKINYEDEDGKTQVGEIIFDPLDETREGIINEAVSFFEGIVKWREHQRESYVSNIGLLPANLLIDNNLEEEPTVHPFSALYADIDDYSDIMTAVTKKYPKKSHPLSRIMSRFFADSKRIIEKEFNVVVDKFVGDEIIILVGAPFDKEGKDAFGNFEPDFVKYMETSYAVAMKLQKLLDEISKEIETKLKIELPRPLRFASGAGLLVKSPVGIYGDLYTKGAGVDYTSISPEMNLIARVLANADGDEFLMPLETFEKYEAKGGKKLEAIGEPYEVPAKGAPGGTVKVVKIRKK